MGGIGSIELQSILYQRFDLFSYLCTTNGTDTIDTVRFEFESQEYSILY